MTPNGDSRLDRIEAALDRLSANAERQDRAAERHDRSIEHLFDVSRQRDRDIDRLIEIANRHNETFERIASTLEALVESGADHETRIADNEAKIQEARKLYEEELKRGAEVHRELEEKLNALIEIVDETIRKKPKNGDQPKSG